MFCDGLYIMQIATYPLQVSGHRPLLFHSEYVLKPFQVAEYDFYRNSTEHTELLPYIPIFYGITFVDQRETTTTNDHVDTHVSGELVNREISLTRQYILISFLSLFFFLAISLFKISLSLSLNRVLWILKWE